MPPFGTEPVHWKIVITGARHTPLPSIGAPEAIQVTPIPNKKELFMSYIGSEHALSKATATPINVGAHIFREAREAKGYSIEDLAVTCGLTAAEIRDVEMGLEASPGYLRRVAAALGLPDNAPLNA
jgi:Helix-turn-helix domain